MKYLRLLALALALPLAACGPADDGGGGGDVAPEPVGTLEGDSGKADGLTFKVKDYFRHTRDLLLEDLSGRVADLATDELNDLLGEVPYLDLKLGETELFSAEGGSEDGFALSSLRDLATGLTRRFGEEDFVAAINDVRARHLEGSDDDFFAESTFAVGLEGHPSFSIHAGDIGISLGFGAGEKLQVRAVFAHEGTVGAVTTNPLKAVRELRGFVLPRGLDDLRSLSPGESIGLAQRGTLGMNVGANLPVFSVSPIEYLTLSARFSLGARVVVRGDVDVQLVRGEDETLYVDVGITDSELESVRAALEDGFGLHGIPALLEVSVAGNTYSLGALAEKVVGNYLRKSGLLDFGAEGSLSRNEERLTLHRFEIDLSVGTADLDAAVRQLACGDLRLAQALADREGSGVRTLVSLARQLNARRRYLGAHISSLAFFKDVAESGGRVYLATPEGVQELVFTRLKESSGKFFRRWGFERLLVTSQTWKGGDYERATANLRLAVSEADRFTDRDQILDHVDALLRPVLPFDDLAGTLTPAFEDLLRQVEDECGECRTDPECDHWEWKECVEDTAAAIGAEAWREETWAAGEVLLDDLLDGAYEPASAGAEDIARALMALKLDLSAFLEAGTFSDVAGKTAMLTDVRVSMEGLDHVFRTTDGMAFEARVRELLTLFLYRRFKDADVTRRKLEGDLDDEAERIAGVRAIYEAGRAEYLALDDAAGVRLAGRPVGNGAFVLSAVGAESTEATIRSLAERKGALATRVLDDIIDRSEQLDLLEKLFKVVTLGLGDLRGFEPHHLAAYTVLSLVPPQHREVLATLEFEEEAFDDVRLYAKGEGADLIEAGEFDLDRLLGR